jgi:hypothetical protein
MCSGHVFYSIPLFVVVLFFETIPSYVVHSGLTLLGSCDPSSSAFGIAVTTGRHSHVWPCSFFVPSPPWPSPQRQLQKSLYQGLR